MKRILVAMCFVGAFGSTAHGQTSNIQPVHVSAGTVLTYYLHARLNPTNGNEVDGLPKGTLLRVKMRNSIDSAVNADGTEFHRTVVSGLTWSGDLVINYRAYVRGIITL